MTPCNDYEDVLRSVQSWLNRQPEKTLTIRKEELGYEVVFYLIPTNTKAISVQLHLGYDGTFCLFLGENIGVSDEDYDISFILEVLEAARTGLVREKIVTRKDSGICGKSEVFLNSDPWKTGWCKWWKLLNPLLLFSKAKVVEVQYERWDRV